MMVVDVRPRGQNAKHVAYPEGFLDELHLAREDERRRLSIEIHDGVAQWMIGALYRIKACTTLLSQQDHDRLGDELSGIEKTLQKSVRELRRIIADLRPLPLEELGLVAAIRQMVASLEEEGITCHFSLEGVLPAMTPAEERATFSIARETLTNIRKHSRATRMGIRLRFHQGGVSLHVRDNGVGFRPETVLSNQISPGHIGLLGMKDTATLVGACLEVRSTPGEGTSVRFTLPTTVKHTVLSPERGNDTV